MPKLEYFLICESMSTDQETSRVSLFNVLDDLQVLTPKCCRHRRYLAGWRPAQRDDGERVQSPELTVDMVPALRAVYNNGRRAVMPQRASEGAS